MIIYCYNDSGAGALSPKGSLKLLPNFKVAPPGWPWNGPINLPAAAFRSVPFAGGFYDLRNDYLYIERMVFRRNFSEFRGEGEGW